MEQGSGDSFFLIGVSHKTAPVEIREKLSLDGDLLTAVLTDIRDIGGVSGCVALSTCNRTEVYAAIRKPEAAARERIRERLIELSGPGGEVAEHLYTFEGKGVVEHLFRVASGLDSMILGEPQILGQVKNAYSLACDRKTTCMAINRLFHHAFRVGKLIRNLTSIGEGTVSVSVAAVELSRRIFGDLTGRSVLLVGAGKIGELCARRLVESGMAHLFIANRTPSRAADLAGRLAGEAVPFESILELCGRVDILITSAAAREPIIRKDMLAPVLERRSGEPLVLIDLGVPRNIDPAVSGCGCAYLYNIDDLEDVTLGNREHRLLEAEKAEELIRGEVEAFRRRMSEREVAPLIRSLYDRCEGIRREELEKVRNRVDNDTFELFDLVTRRIVRKLLHQPTVAMRSFESAADRERVLATVRELFMDRISGGPRTEAETACQTPENRKS